jgi:putative flippase GtrA
MGKKLYDLIEKIAVWFLGLIFKLLKKDMTEQVRSTFTEFIKFGLVGVSNTIVSYLLYAVTLQVLIKLNIFPAFVYIIANIVSFLLSVLWSFYWNNKYVFKLKDGEERSIWRALLKTYVSYGVTGIVLNNILLFLWVDTLGIHKMVAPIINLVINIPINFFMNKLWAFSKKK